MIKLLQICTTMLICSTGLLAQVVTDFIHVDQFGYLPDADKVAVISDPIDGYNGGLSYTPGSSYQVIDESNNSVVYTGSPTSWGGGATHVQSGDKGWWFDFSSVTTPGTYHLLDVSNNTKSYTFEIKEDVYIDVLKAAVKMFYYNRCNMVKSVPYADPRWVDGDNFENALQDANCRFLNDPGNASLEKDLSGGWFDAGDYNKYVTFATNPVHQLLYAYQDHPDLFTDDWNIPESGNGISDLLDEVIYELEWLEKMINADGTVIIKMGSINYLNANSPPSNNFDQRYYGPTCTSASIAAAGMLAHAALVLEQIPGLATYASTLESKAISCFSYALPLLNSDQLETNCDDGTINAGDADWSTDLQKQKAVLAAVYLWELTGSSVYQNYIVSNINDVIFINANWLGNGTNSELEALLHYATLPGASTAVINEINNSLTPHVTGDWNNFFEANDIDLYRSNMPDWSYNWGSNLGKSQYGVMSKILKKYDFNPSKNDSYEEKAAEQLHYFHGINPLNIVYLSNMYDFGGDNCVNEIYHGWFADGTIYDHALNSTNGPAPGFVPGGANPAFSIPSISPPSGQPMQKSYLDFNDDWPDNSWEISEPAIYYQAGYIRLVAHYTKQASCSSRSSAYVDLAATGNGSGNSWADAYPSLEAALSAECISLTDTLKVAEGTYIPVTNDRSFVYSLQSDLVIQGGYQSGGTAYDPAIYEVVLSGNIGNPNSDLDNLYHAFTFTNATMELTLANLTISGGYANGSGVNAVGGGIYTDADLTLDNVKVTDNAAANDSEGIYSGQSANIIFLGECTLTGNIKL